jgi:chemotaxis signal transduction protein
MLDGSIRAARGLECLVGGARLGIPAESVKQIIEYEVISPVPLARPGFAGLGVFDEKVIVSITLITPRPGVAEAAGRRGTKGVLLHVPESTIDWALEVTGIVGFTEVDVASDRGSAPGVAELGPGLTAPWIGQAVTGDGRTIGWVDMHGILGDLLSFRPDGPAPGGQRGRL